jgi:hypothetical protein
MLRRLPIMPGTVPTRSDNNVQEITPISPEALVEELADRVAQLPGWVRVAVDGADASRPEELADALVTPLRARGRQTVRVRAQDHLRPAALRFERGRADPDSFYEDWWDADGLAREVLMPLEPGGSGRIRPVRFDARIDRASRTGFETVAPEAILIVSGPLLLGRGLPFELTVHLELGPAALARRTPPEQQWTVPAYERYIDEVDPAAWADVVVRWDDPRHPAVVTRAA